MIESLRELSGNMSDEGEYQLFIVGGFDDDRNSSIELTLSLFSQLILLVELFEIRI